MFAHVFVTARAFPNEVGLQPRDSADRQLLRLYVAQFCFASQRIQYQRLQCVEKRALCAFTGGNNTAVRIWDDVERCLNNATRVRVHLAFQDVLPFVSADHWRSKHSTEVEDYRTRGLLCVVPQALFGFQTEAAAAVLRQQ